MRQSGVTERPRMVEFFRSFAGHVNENTSIVSRTHDLARENIDYGNAPLLNLLKFDDDGREGIAEDANGFHLFWAANGAKKVGDVEPGEIVDAVPDRIIAGDRSVPHNTVLEPAISCIRCHASDAGWRIVRNDVKYLVKDLLDIFTDISRKRQMPIRTQDEIDRILGLYRGDPELKALPRARNDLANAYLTASGVWDKTTQVDIVKRGSAEIARIFDTYNFGRIHPSQALLDLGLDIEDLKVDVIGLSFYDQQRAGDRLKALLMPLKGQVAPDLVLTEDPVLGLLEAGLDIDRREYDLRQSFISARVAARLAAEGQLKK
jgi:hypothetical protein